jgi:hypothetical protein
VRVLLEERAAGPFAGWAKRDSQDRRPGHAAVKSSAASHNITAYCLRVAVNHRGSTVSETKHRAVETNGIQMHLAECGVGPLVVLCHGFPESSMFGDSFPEADVSTGRQGRRGDTS